MQEIYLDNCATTCCDTQPAELAAMMMTKFYGNPSSLHKKGLEGQIFLEKARDQLAIALGCEPCEFSFTSGGTAANNIAVIGAALAQERRGKKIVAQSTLHSSILEPLKMLAAKGFDVKLVPPLKDGNADLDQLEKLVEEETILFCCELVNSEMGAILELEKLAKVIGQKNKNTHIHCDAVQAFGKLPFSASKTGADSISVSGHKIHGPKGAGGLYLKKGRKLKPILFGGSSENALSPGTENTPAFCAFGKAAEVAAQKLEQNLEYMAGIYEYFVNNISFFQGVCINSPPNATPYLCNISVENYRAETLLHFLGQRGIFVSTGSACSKGAASHVLKAMGLSPQRIDSALRLGFSKYTTTKQLDVFFDSLKEGMNTLVRSKN